MYGNIFVLWYIHCNSRFKNKHLSIFKSFEKFERFLDYSSRQNTIISTRTMRIFILLATSSSVHYGIDIQWMQHSPHIGWFIALDTIWAWKINVIITDTLIAYSNNIIYNIPICIAKHGIVCVCLCLALFVFNPCWLP